MAVTTAGRDLIASLIIGAGTSLNSANGYIGVGDSSAAFAVGQVDLQAATNKYRQGMAATYPTVLINVLTLRSLFPADQANFVWAEWGLFNAPSGGSMLSRKVEALGTKPNSEAWQMTVTLTVVVT